MYTTDYRALDVRLGRWFSPDGIVHHSQSPYVSMNNNPIALIDPLGLEADGGGVGGSGSGAPGGGGGESIGQGGAPGGSTYSTPSPIQGDNSGSFDFAKVDINSGYHAQEVTIVADRGKASKAWYDYFSETVKSGAYGELVNSLYNAKVDEYTKGMGGGLSKAYYGTTITGNANLPQQIYDKCRDEAEKEALPLLKDYWARKMSNYDGWGFLEPTDMTNYYTYKAETVTSKDEGYSLLTDVGFEVVNAWGLRFSIGLRTVKPIMNTKNATAGAGAGGIAGAVSGGEKIALGVSETLDDFAKGVGGKTWKTWGADSFESQFMETINNPLNEIHFNLDGIDGVWKAISEGAKGLSSSRVTSWELYQIYSNPSVLKRTIFYRGGAVVPAPF